MASWSGTTGPAAVARSAGEDGLAYAVRGCGNPAHAYPGRMVNRIEDGRRRRDHGLFADAFRPEWPYGRGVFNQDRFDRRYIAGRGNQVVMQVFAFARKKFLH